MSWKTWNGNTIKAKVAARAGLAARKAAEVTGEAADQQVPLDEGTLKSSKIISTDGQTTAISYGWGNTSGKPEIPYAVRWHENAANFQRGRKKNYLRDPVKMVAPNALKLSIKKELGDYFG